MECKSIEILFMAKETLSSKYALTYLCRNSDKIKVSGAVIRNSDFELKKICNENNIRILTEEEIKCLWEEGVFSIDYIISFYWKRVKKEILNIPKKGGINFHPGPLPEARGSGYHVAILENWGYWGVTAHYMDEEFDTGAIIECRHFPIDSQIVNRDLLQLTHKQLCLLFEDVMDRVVYEKPIVGKRQGEGRYFSIREIENSKEIYLDDDPEEIDRKIRAFWNPPYNGAQITIHGQKYTVINEKILKWIAQKLVD